MAPDAASEWLFRTMLACPPPSRLASMEPKLPSYSCHPGIDVMTADTMIRGAASTSLYSSVLSWSLRMIGAAIRIVLLLLVAVLCVSAMSIVYLADVRSTSRMKSQRSVVRKNLRRQHASVRRPTLQLSSY